MKPSHPRNVLATIAALTFCVGAVTDANARGGSPKSKGDYNNPECTAWVTGSNSSPNDVIALDIAINRPDAPDISTVCLEGTFNFGATDFVGISPAANVGTLRITGINGATIWYGLQPLRFLQSSTLQKLTIDHIRFVEPEFTAISIFQGNDLVQISDNIIDGVRTTPPTVLLPGFPELTYREGIVVTSAFADITGTVDIKDNWVDAGLYDSSNNPVSNVNFGVGVFGAWLVGNPYSITADVKISGNTVTNWSGSGIGTRALDADTVVEHNLVEPGPWANDAPGACVANGIDLIGTSNASVQGNTINVVPTATINLTQPECTTAILLRSDAPRALATSDNTVRNNQIRGHGLYGIVINGISTAHSDDNTFVANHMSNFDSDEADVSLNSYANYNTFKGNVGTVLDNGAGNTFITPGGP